MFDEQEIQILLDALDVWESKDTSDALMSGMLGMMFIDDRERAKESMEAELEEGKRKTVLRKEQAILIKAKLIQLKNKIAAGEAANFLRDG